MSDAPLVSVIVVTFNSSAWIKECLACARAQDYKNFELIVVDQHSQDGTADLVAADFPEVQLIRHATNTGFADGMNRGIRTAVGHYAFLVNADLFLEPTFISHAVGQLEIREGERVGMLASIVYRYANGQRTEDIDCAGCDFLPYHTAVNSDCVGESTWVACPAGAAMFLQREMLEDIKLPSGDYLDSTYFCYGEDIELALRAQLLGWKCLFAPIIAGWHVGGGATGERKGYSEKPPVLLTHALKNRYLSLISCYPFGLLVRFFLPNLMAECGQVAVPIIRRRWVHMRCQMAAYWAVWRMLPSLLAKRRWLQRRRCVSTRYLRSLYVRWSFARMFASLLQKV